jgi:hypothetical protein
MTSSLQLRPEARPLKWEDLNVAQQQALTQLAQQITNAIDDLPNRDKEADRKQRVLTWVRHDALARLSMLEGGRGSGKTTVLLSLLELCGKAKDLNLKNAALQSMLEKIDRRTVWLDPIELDMFPLNANFLGAILARLELRITRQLMHTSAKDDQEALRRLNTLYRKVTVVGDDKAVYPFDNLDSYAVNVKRIEGERLELRNQFGDLLDELALRVFRTSHSEPIFVLPIDDIDLNPMHCFSVLNVLRQIGVPRLYTVLLGKFEIARTVVHRRFLEDFSQGGLMSGGMADQFAEETSEAWLRKSIPPQQRIKVTELTAAEILKFRPPSQTSALNASLLDLLAQLPVLIKPPDEFACLGPGDAMQMPLAFEKTVPTFLDFCLFPGFNVPSGAWPVSSRISNSESSASSAHYRSIESEDLEQLEKRAIYRAPGKIRAVPRNVIDIWFRARHAVDATQDPDHPEVRVEFLPYETRWKRWQELLKLLLALCQEEIGRDRTLRIPEQNHLSQLLDRVLKDEADLGALPLTFTVDVDPVRIVRTSDVFLLNEDAATGGKEGANEPGKENVKDSSKEPAKDDERAILSQRSILVREMRGWQLHFGEGKEQKVCSSETTAQFMMFHDLMTLSNRRLHGIFPDYPGEQRWAVTEWNAGPYGSLSLHWPHPLLSSFWEYEIFLYSWNRVIREVAPINPSSSREPSFFADAAAESIMYTWIDFSQAIMTWSPPCSPSGISGAAPSEEQWGQLFERLDAAAVRAEDATLFGVRISRWLMRIALLLTPELLGMGLRHERTRMGGTLTGSALRKVQLGPNLQRFWLRNRPFIKDSRTKHLAALASEGMEEVALMIIKQSKRSGGGLQAILRRTAPDIEQVKLRAKRDFGDSAESSSKTETSP